LVIKALDPYWIRIRIRIGIQHQTLDPDPEKINADPQPCQKQCTVIKYYTVKKYTVNCTIVLFRTVPPQDRRGAAYERVQVLRGGSHRVLRLGPGPIQDEERVLPPLQHSPRRCHQPQGTVAPQKFLWRAKIYFSFYLKFMVK
jgi:hypothetical protein